MTVDSLDKDVTPNTSTILTVDRTRLANDQTLMAWVHTSTSLISFGFTIYEFAIVSLALLILSALPVLVGETRPMLLLVGDGEAERQPLTTASYPRIWSESHAASLSSEIHLPWNTDLPT